MRNEYQVESTVTVNRAKIYKMILAVFDKLPAKFKASELYELAAIPSAHMPLRRATTARILEQDFKCIVVGNANNRYWKKP